MNESLVSEWFSNLKQIWVEKDISSIGNLLSDTFQYFEDPNEDPLRNLKDIEAAWQEVNKQENIELEIIPLVIKDREGTARYHLKYRDEVGTSYESLGVYYVSLDEVGKAKEFRQWWVSK